MGRLFWDWHLIAGPSETRKRAAYLKLPGSFEKSYGYCQMKPIVEELKHRPFTMPEKGVLIEMFFFFGRQWCIAHNKPLRDDKGGLVEAGKWVL